MINERLMKFFLFFIETSLQIWTQLFQVSYKTSSTKKDIYYMK